MLPKINRIKKKKDFEAIYKKSKSFKNNLFIFKVMENGLDFSRFGFVVSLKVSKKATLRNKARRRLSEAIKSQEKNIKPGIDAVIIALPGIEKKEFSEIKKAVTDMLTKTKLNV
ncbi:MAG: ribonuclease P protein component [Candidatus Staskawiczbacteria bacterium RIFOXYB1_FULL_37_44]|uniref:Ribonuclease P protein component n=1 Tax=Candidatus Staskawiczbacteria bacterium RIFOXYB1_FULL_37_44 TaxID=1802223 RepID=A0A1G2IUE8_9BACT|nr:MAG: ribonuclease P protein component [Candidatus Staskawiczbacteria bacterium RIFOXYB1_FULL_37_44]OGZ84396.1 MAG: ribonuclease P protein component [Candidatus Staskawiczbacteria bacterium RIFOXYC1_FULL_37_52]OGZ89451.1 MAG: ribonuclease P protein component [Candidatus Staskawiczbacteria bacterium RIFOXYC2_FULL_37_19]OGZ89820.1 MAG: ribonuclease P protein component [Candidatus Staskawiczbacteria bacterium RIFOXYD1_FULL_37_110]